MTSKPPTTSTLTMILDNFESGRIQNWRSFQSDHSRAAGTVVSPGQFGAHAMKLDFGIGEGGWGGIERTFGSSQDWTLYQKISFGFYGTNSGATIRFEILENRAPGSNGDTAERFEYSFIDNFNGWRTFDLPWSAFVRRTDWQPAGAPNDGFHRSAVWGFNISPVNGQGSFQIDEIKLTKP